MDYYRGAFGGNIAFAYLKRYARGTIGIIAVNVLVYLITLVLGIQQWSIWMGGMTELGYILLTGQYWRFLTAMFIHADLLHLVFNMIILMHAGGYLEPQLGFKRFIAFYGAAGLLVSLFTGLLSSGLSVGASGALFALLGYILYFDLEARKRGIVTGSMILPLVGVNIIFTLIVPGISTVGHLSGLAIGYLYGFFKTRVYKKN
ncbi:MAG: rhomboid family intramembrane serine protease [Peptococcaceae bacterium]